MFIEKYNKHNTLLELMFVECSRVICNKDKEEKDKVKLWREMNDGLNYVYKFNKVDKDEFGILGIQIAGKMMHFNILIRDIYDVHRLYHLDSIEIPVEETVDKIHVSNFIKTSLHIRNILIINISLLLNSSQSRSNQ
jgi:hypothetical protein